MDRWRSPGAEVDADLVDHRRLRPERDDAHRAGCHIATRGPRPAPAGFSVRRPVASEISKRLCPHISQSVCPWNAKFSQALAEDSPFRAREFIAGKDAVTLARDILALDQEAFSAAFRKSPMKRAKLAGLRRNAVVVRANAGSVHVHVDERRE